MPKEQDEIEDMDVESSTASEDVVSEAAEQAVEAAPAESSTATDETEVDTLSIVRDVVGEKTEEQAEAASSAEGEEGTGEGEGEQPPQEPSDDYSDVPFHKHPRFQQLIREKKALEGPASEWAKVNAYMDSTGLSPEEAANGVTIMGLAKMDPTEAFKQVAPWFQKLAMAAGEILPEDLAARVQKGELPKDVALEMSRLRAAQNAGRVRQDFEAQRGQRQQQTNSAQAVHNAAETWEQDRLLKDPNFAAKQPLIRKKLEFLHSTGQVPTTPEGVKEQLKLVYADVNRELGAKAAAQTRQAPKKPALQPVRGGQVAGNARVEAPSGKRETVDIVNDVLSKRRA